VAHKASRLLQLARQHQCTRWRGYRCIGDYHAGAYECDFVSPYTRSAQNLNASVMVFLQDWASDRVLSGPFVAERNQLGHNPRGTTNANLKLLLHENFALQLSDVYATNLFPFVKLGSQNARIPGRDLVMLTLQCPAASLTSASNLPPAKAWLMNVWRP
jgi:hypothetical protein